MEKDDDDDEADEDRGHRGRRSESELAAQVRTLIERRGGGESGAQAVALKLLDDNEKARAGRAKWRERAEKAEALIPKADEVVVKKTDADAFVKYKELGTPEEVKAKVEKGVTLEAATKQREQSEAVTASAPLAGLKNGKLLAKLARADRENFVVELRDEKRDGKDVKVPFAKKNEANAAFKPLAEFAKTELADYLPALMVGEEGAAGGSAGSNGAASTSSFVPFVEQSAASTAPAKAAVDKAIEQQHASAAAKTNPLRPAAATTKT